MKIILVTIGVFQEYIIDNIKQLQLQGNKDIVILTEKRFFENFIKNNLINIELIDINEYNSDYVQEFKNNLKLDKIFRNGFWVSCSLRFLYIYEYLKNNNISNIIHIENDNMIYENLDIFSKDKFNENKLYLTFDAYHRVIPGIMYIPNHNILKIILDNYNMYHNDMDNLGKYYNSSIVEPFPIISIYDNNIHYFNMNFLKFNCIFDGAAIGQYLGGVDRKNDPNDTRGFINETCLIKYNNYKFYWKKINDLWNPFIEIDNNLIKIINLHIHSKDLYKFLSNNPEENKYISKIYIQ
jgi:hypothetical protein